MAMMKGSQILVDCLIRMGCQRIYGIIGTSVLSFVDALYDHKDEIRYISCRHEQVAASMADTEGRLTGRPGVVLAHSGPGALNTLISLANAYKDCSPVIAIVGAVKRRLRGKDGMLEVDHLKVFSPICKGAYRVEETASIPTLFSQAYSRAMSGAKGPVLIEVPEDVWKDRAEVDLEKFSLELEPLPEAQEEDIKELIAMIRSSSKPLILAGGGVAYSQASEDLVRFAETLNLPVITTGNGRGTIPEDHPLCLGRVGFGGGRTVADTAYEKADLILGMGCLLSDMTTYEFSLPTSADVVLVNLDADVEKKKLYVKKQIYADVSSFLKKILKMLSSSDKVERKDWLDSFQAVKKSWQELLEVAKNSSKSPLSPGRFCYQLGKMLPKEAIITVGAGMHLLYPMAFIPCCKPLTFLSAVNFGAMGFGFPSGLAAKLIYKERMVISILGDGDFLMTLQDLETAKREGLALKIFILNDNSYRVLAYRQKLQFQGRVYGSEHKNPDFVKLASAFGVRGVRIERPEEIEPKLKEVFKEDDLVLTEVVCDPNDLPPMNINATLKMGQ